MGTPKGGKGTHLRNSDRLVYNTRSGASTPKSRESNIGSMSRDIERGYMSSKVSTNAAYDDIQEATDMDIEDLVRNKEENLANCRNEDLEVITDRGNNLRFCRIDSKLEDGDELIPQFSVELIRSFTYEERLRLKDSLEVFGARYNISMTWTMFFWLTKEQQQIFFFQIFDLIEQKVQEVSKGFFHVFNPTTASKR